MNSFSSNGIQGMHFKVMTNETLRKDLKIKSMNTRLGLLSVLEEIKTSSGKFQPQSERMERILQLFPKYAPKPSKTEVKRIESYYYQSGNVEKIEFVRKKVLDHTGGFLPTNLKKTKLEKCFHQSMVDKDLLLKNYLTSDFKTTEEILLYLLDLMSPEKSHQQITSPKNDLEKLRQEELKSQYRICNLPIYIKIVFLETSSHHQEPSDNKKTRFSKLFNPVITSFPSFFPNTHHDLFLQCAVVVGPWILEWNKSGIVVPKKCYFGAAHYIVDQKRVYRGKYISIIEKVAEAVAMWNSSQKYEPEICNCVHFVEFILQKLPVTLKCTLNIIPSPQRDQMNSIQKFLFQMKTGKGRAIMEWEPSKRINEIFVKDGRQYEKKGLKKKYVFVKHSELDDFIDRLQRVDPLCYERSDIQYDLTVLKSFDAIFRLRYQTLVMMDASCIFVTESITGIESNENYGVLPIGILHKIFLFISLGDLKNIFLSCSLFKVIGNTSLFWKEYYFQEMKDEDTGHRLSTCCTEKRNWKEKYFERRREILLERCKDGEKTTCPFEYTGAILRNWF